MIETHETTIARQTGIIPRQVEAVHSLIDEGATIPFIARYRKEKTEPLDEVLLGAMRGGLTHLAASDARRKVILESPEEKGVPTDALLEAIRLITKSYFY